MRREEEFRRVEKKEEKKEKEKKEKWDNEEKEKTNEGTNVEIKSKETRDDNIIKTGRKEELKGRKNKMESLKNSK